MLSRIRLAVLATRRSGSPARAEPSEEPTLALHVESGHSRIHAVVRAIPKGRVSTYGDVAVLTGMPGHARLVGYALHALSEHTAVPWHRVVNARGGISLGRARPGGEVVQRMRLEAEGIAFGPNGRIDLRQFRWQPP